MARMVELDPQQCIGVVSMNVWGTRGEWEQRRSVLKSGLAALRPDLVTFQEVIETEQYDQAVTWFVMSSSPAISMPIRTQPACASGPGDSPWTA